VSGEFCDTCIAESCGGWDECMCECHNHPLVIGGVSLSAPLDQGSMSQDYAHALYLQHKAVEMGMPLVWKDPVPLVPSEDPRMSYPHATEKRKCTCRIRGDACSSCPRWKRVLREVANR